MAAADRESMHIATPIGTSDKGVTLEWQKCFPSERHLDTCRVLEKLSSTGLYKTLMEVTSVVCGRRSPFLTGTGHIGLGPGTIRPGGLVGAPRGANMLHVLRNTDNEYRLICDCFVDGLMDGEIITAMSGKAALSSPIMKKPFLASLRKGSNGQPESSDMSCPAFIEVLDQVLDENLYNCWTRGRGSA